MEFGVSGFKDSSDLEMRNSGLGIHLSMRHWKLENAKGKTRHSNNPLLNNKE